MYPPSSVYTKENPLLIYVDGKQYDLTTWREKHPGGSFILEKFMITLCFSPNRQIPPEGCN